VYSNAFMILAVILGTLVLVAVLINYMRNVPLQSVTVTSTLILIGFVLVSSPLWGSISLKARDFELALLRDYSETQLRGYVQLLEDYQRLLEPAKARVLSKDLSALKRTLVTLEKGSATVTTEQKIRTIRDASKVFIKTTNAILAVRG